MSVADLSKEIWMFKLEHDPEFALFKGIIPLTPKLDPLTPEAFSNKKVG